MLLWGDAMPWETIVFDATPISYAQCGLFRQFHREERDVYNNIAFLMRARSGSVPPERNVPNKYLAGGCRRPHQFDRTGDECRMLHVFVSGWSANRTELT
jgi:hypothetical protein